MVLVAAVLLSIPTQAQTLVNKQAYQQFTELKSGPQKAVNLMRVRSANIDVLPYSNALNTEELYGEFTVIDNNNDGATWSFNEYMNTAYYSNGQIAADDWLISPAIKLEAGKLYHFAIDALCSSANYPEKFEVKLGAEPTAAALTQSVIGETTVKNTNPITYENEGIAVAETGYYHFGIHAISNADMWNLMVSNFFVEVGASPSAPAMVSDLIVSQVSGEAKVSVSFKAPSTAINGNALTANISRIEILRNDEVIKTLENVAPGSEQNYEDVVPSVGKYTYQVIPYDADGPGQKSEVKEIKVVYALDVPYTFDMTQDLLDLFQIIDNNNDGATWQWSSYNGIFYNYSYENAADDYLISLPFNLKAGKGYNIIMVAKSASSYSPEKFEVKIGKEPTVAGLSQTVIPETKVAVSEPTDYEQPFTVAEDGEYYIAIHATSDANSFSLIVNSLSIEAGSEQGSPAAISDLTATAGEQGALEANLAFTTPTQAVDGSALSGTVDVKVYRDKVLVYTLSGLATGTAQTWKDTGLEDGKTYTYYVVASNEAGDGLKSEKVSVYVGQDDMADVTGFQVLSTTANTISFSWNEVTGKNDGYVNTNKVKYAILSVTIESTPWGDFFVEHDTLGVVTGETSGTFDYPVDEGEQGYHYFGVKAINGERMTNISLDSYTFWLAGAPYDLPMTESFTGGAPKYNTWETTGSQYTKGVLTSDASDGDGTGLFITTLEQPGFVMLKSGKVNLTNATNPTLLFDTKGQGITKAVVMGSVDDGEWTEIQEVNLTEEFATAKVPLTNTKGTRFTRFAIGADIVNNSIIDGYDYETWQYIYKWNDLLFIDNIKVVDLLQNDLAIDVTTQEKVTAGANTMIYAIVENKGENAANGYTVKITAGEQELLNKAVNGVLKPFDKETFKAVLSTSIFDDAADMVVKAEVIFDNDQDETNNVAETIISIKEPAVAQPVNVTAQQNAEGGVDIAWETPSADTPSELTEDFQNYENGANDTGLLGNWTLVDNNGATKGAIFQDFPLPSDGQAKAWELMMPSAYGINFDEFKGPNGSLSEAYLMSRYNVDPVTQTYPNNDDWLISPELPGIAQTISFAISAFDQYFGTTGYASYEVLASSTDKEIINFTKVAEGNLTKFGWVTAEASLPEGTKYFAIRNTTNGNYSFMMLLGDITYVNTGAEVAAYNIYYEGELIATVTGDQTTYTVAADKLEDGARTFAVSTVNPRGAESKPVSVTINVTVGIQQIITDGQAFDVYSIDGKLVRSQVRDLNGLHGVYVINGKTVMVK